MWRGVIIEESLNDKSLLEYVDVVSTKSALLEKEEFKGMFHFHNVQVPDDRIEEVVERAKAAIKDRWYIHLCKGDEMIAIYKGKDFRYTRGNADQLAKLREYGLAIGINEAQLPDDRLIEEPWD
jgi:hypothetical protein